MGRTSVIRVVRGRKKRFYRRATEDGGILCLVLGLGRPNAEEKLLRGMLFGKGFGKKRFKK